MAQTAEFKYSKLRYKSMSSAERMQCKVLSSHLVLSVLTALISWLTLQADLSLDPRKCFLIMSFHATAYGERGPVYFFQKRIPNSRWWLIHTVCKKLSSTNVRSKRLLTLSWKHRQDLYLQTQMSFSDSQPYHYRYHWSISTSLTFHHASRL